MWFLDITGTVHIKPEENQLYSIEMAPAHKELVLFTQLATNIVPLCLLVISNAMLLVKYRRQIGVKMARGQQRDLVAISRKEMRFTVITIAQSFLLIAVNALKIVFSTIYTVSFGAEMGGRLGDYAAALKTASFHFVFVYHALSVLFNVFGDSNLYRLIIKSGRFFSDVNENSTVVRMRMLAFDLWCWGGLL